MLDILTGEFFWGIVVGLLGFLMEWPRRSVSKAKVLNDQVRRINAFFAQRVIRGGKHRSFVRIFNEGNKPGFDWNKGGRLYSNREDSYQQLPREQRLQMTIDGQPLCEMDIRASYLTIIHARYRQPFVLSRDVDPYAIDGFPRDVVKTWCVIRFGTKAERTSWPVRSVQRYAKDHGGADLNEYSAQKVGRAVIRRYPLLGQWPQLPETWADLMWLESEAVVATVEQLFRRGVPSLPVHDSLLVPLAEEITANRILSTNYRRVVGVSPVLTVKYPEKYGYLAL
jgi:hypothetical protein